MRLNRCPDFGIAPAFVNLDKFIFERGIRDGIPFFDLATCFAEQGGHPCLFIVQARAQFGMLFVIHGNDQVIRESRINFFVRELTRGGVPIFNGDNGLWKRVAYHFVINRAHQHARDWHDECQKYK